MRVLNALVLIALALTAAPHAARAQSSHGMNVSARGADLRGPRYYVAESSTVQVAGYCHPTPSHGAGSFTPEFEWSVLSGCAGCSITTPTSATTTITNVPVGVSRVQLKCSHPTYTCEVTDWAYILRDPAE